MNTLIALARKEFQQHVKAAATLALVLAAALAYVDATGSSYAAETVFGPSFALISRVGFPLIAVVITLLTNLAESKGDAWAFLVHRPVPPANLFWGKLVGGLSLYAFATLIPYGLYLLWVSQPGNLSNPFEWRMALPGLAGIACGMVYIPVIMMLVFGRARWYVSRLLPLVAAFTCSLFDSRAYEFSQAVISIGVFFTLACLAARFTFLRAFPALPKNLALRASALAYALTLFIALTVICSFAGSFASAYLPSLLPQRNAPELYSSIYVFDKQGHLAVLGYEKSRATLQTLQDQPIGQWDMRVDPEKEFDLVTLPTAYLYTPGFNSVYSPGPGSRYSQNSRYFIRIFDFSSYYWAYRLDTGAIEAYRPGLRQFMGTFGPSGFTKPDQTPQPPFDGKYITTLGDNSQATTQRLVFSTSIYNLNFDEFKLIAEAFRCDPGETILSAAATEEKSGTNARYIVLTSRRLLILDPQNQITFETDMPDALYAKPLRAARFYQFPNAMTIVPSYNNYEDFMHPPLVIQINPAAKTAVAFTPPPLQINTAYTPPTLPYAITSFANSPGLILMGHLSPRPELAEMRKLTQSWLIACAALSFLASLTIGMVRKLPVGKLLGWAFLNAFLGIPGLLLMAILTPRPASKPCPGCHKPHPLNQLLCPACHAPFPMPAPNGTEVFSPL